ncbi:MAG TPA: MarR family transcriptional regulator [Frankiaceae bacterium]|nr:MarR family transcriptional regulator [Frankiaceae bacterium]
MSAGAAREGAAGLRDALALPPELGLLSPLTRLTLLVDAEVERIAADHGIAYADYLVLGVVRRSPGGHGRPTEMCAVLGRTTGGMTLTLDRLEAAGWVRRAADRADRRRIVVSLTAEGLRLAEAVNTQLHAWEQSLALHAADRANAGAVLALLIGAVESRVALSA